MAILNDNKLPAQPAEPTSQEVAERVAERIVNMSRETFNQLVRVQRQGITALWEQSKATPQEIIDALGENAVKVFSYHAKITDLVKELATDEGIDVDVKLPTNAFTIDLDGTITVENTPYAG